MRRSILVLAGLGFAGMLALAGCGATTKLTHVWAMPNFETNSLHKLIVIGAAKDVTIRRVFEDTFCRSLGSEGVDAVPSYTVAGEGQLDSTQVKQVLQQTGCDGIFVTRLMDRKTVETYYPPTTTYAAPPGAYYGGYYGYYSMGYEYTSSPGYTVQNEVVNLETNLYRVSDGKLVWSALSESWLEQTGNTGGEIQPFVQQLVYALGDSKVITKTKKSK